MNELISSVPVTSVCVSIDNQSYSGTETRSHVRNKKPDRSPVTKEQVSKHQTTAYKSDSFFQNKRETQSHKFTQPCVVSSIPLHLKPSPDKKFNIVLYGVDECAPGMSRSARQESDLSTVAAVLSSLDSSISSQCIKDCLRLGKVSSKSRPRPILVKFIRICDINKTFSKVRHIPKPYILKPDMSRSQRVRESVLLKERWALIQNGISRKHIKIRDDCLLVNNHLHGRAVNQIFEIDFASPIGLHTTVIPAVDTS